MFGGFGMVLGALGRSWAPLGRLLGVSGRLLGAPWASLGPSWASLGHLGSILIDFRLHFGRFGPSKFEFGGMLDRFGQGYERHLKGTCALPG